MCLVFLPLARCKEGFNWIEFINSYETNPHLNRLYNKIYYHMIVEKELTTDHYEKLAEVLGRDNVPVKIESPFDFIRIASKGVKVSVIKNFSNYFSLTRESVAHILDISEPTLYRWIKANKILERNFSVKLFEIADLFLYGEEVFKDRNSFFKWLNLPNDALGGLEPYNLIEIPGGISKIRDILGRIEYGVYS